MSAKNIIKMIPSSFRWTTNMFVVFIILSLSVENTWATTTSQVCKIIRHICLSFVQHSPNSCRKWFTKWSYLFFLQFLGARAYLFALFPAHYMFSFFCHRFHYHLYFFAIYIVWHKTMDYAQENKMKLKSDYYQQRKKRNSK